MNKKKTEISFEKDQLEYLAIGIRKQLNNLGPGDNELKNNLCPILTKLLKGLAKLENTNK